MSLVEIIETETGTTAQVLGNKLFSQVKLHEQYGGVYPNLAKREHAKNLGPLIREVFKEAGAHEQTMQPLRPSDIMVLRQYLEREPELFQELTKILTALKRPDIDAIAVTQGPGLEPALWVGINGARSLAHIWQLPVIPINHMEGHVFSSILQKRDEGAFTIPSIALPALSLLISGGHTELVLVKKWGDYERIGATRDDAVGEAFDKVARMLGLPYPGGPQISKYADAARSVGKTPKAPLPIPMLGSKNFDFSFSGLKTAVRYYLETIPEITEEVRHDIALAFENVVGEVLFKKTARAIDEHDIQTFIMGGGVSANRYLRELFREKLSTQFPDLKLYIPDISLTTDNAVMIAIAGYFRRATAITEPSGGLPIRAQGNLKLH